MSRDVLQRMWRYIEPEPMSGCWIWVGARDRDGYGTFGVDSRHRFRAHRLAYALYRGAIPDELPLDHLCRVRACINPQHLEPVSMRINILRGEGLAAQNARKERCPMGHAYTAYLPNRSGHCRECVRLARRARLGAGICRNCHSAVVPGRLQCAWHLAQDADIHRQRRAMERSA